MFAKFHYKLTLSFVLFSLVPSIFLYALSGNVPLLYLLLVGVCSVILAFVLARMLAQPILLAVRQLAQLSQGELHLIPAKKVVRDERGALLWRCQELVKYLTEVIEVLHTLAQGEVSVNFEPRSSRDELGQECVKLVTYTTYIAQTLRSIGEGQVTAEITPFSAQDQLGLAIQGILDLLQTATSQIRELVEQIVLMTQDVVERSNTEIQNIEKLLNSTEGTSSSMAEMQASVEEVGMNIEALAASFEATSSSIGQMGTSISQVTRNSEKLSDFVERTSAIISQAVSAMEKVSENAENSKILSSDTMRDASKGQDAMKRMSESVQTISETVESATIVIQELEARSDEIGQVLVVIDDIAGQTQLLALNASIIAAQAGEHGRGFAVVADQIKELATRVSESTQEISRIVQTVQADSAKAVAAMDEGNVRVKEGLKLARLAGDALEKIILGAQWSANVANDIADAIQEQTAMNQSIEDSIQDVVNVATENTRATKEQEIGASRVMEAVEKMTALADQVHRATIEQTKGSAEVINATEEMSNLVRNSVQNTQQIMDAANKLAQKSETLMEVLELLSKPNA